MVTKEQWADGIGIRVDSSVNLPELKIGTPTIVTDVGIFVNVPAVGWMRLDLEQAEELGIPSEAVTDPRAYQSSVFPSNEVPWHLYQIESQGQEVVDGEAMEHLSVQMDFPALWVGAERRSEKKYVGGRKL